MATKQPSENGGGKDEDGNDEKPKEDLSNPAVKAPGGARRKVRKEEEPSSSGAKTGSKKTLWDQMKEEKERKKEIKSRAKEEVMKMHGDDPAVSETELKKKKKTMKQLLKQGEHKLKSQIEYDSDYDDDAWSGMTKEEFESSMLHNLVEKQQVVFPSFPPPLPGVRAAKKAGKTHMSKKKREELWKEFWHLSIREQKQAFSQRPMLYFYVIERCGESVPPLIRDSKKRPISVSLEIAVPNNFPKEEPYLTLEEWRWKDAKGYRTNRGHKKMTFDIGPDKKMHFRDRRYGKFQEKCKELGINQESAADRRKREHEKHLKSLEPPTEGFSVVGRDGKLKFSTSSSTMPVSGDVELQIDSEEVPQPTDEELCAIMAEFNIGVDEARTRFQQAFRENLEARRRAVIDARASHGDAREHLESEPIIMGDTGEELRNSRNDVREELEHEEDHGASALVPASGGGSGSLERIIMQRHISGPSGEPAGTLMYRQSYFGRRGSTGDFPRSYLERVFVPSSPNRRPGRGRYDTTSSLD